MPPAGLPPTCWEVQLLILRSVPSVHRWIRPAPRTKALCVSVCWQLVFWDAPLGHMTWCGGSLDLSPRTEGVLYHNAHQIYFSCSTVTTLQGCFHFYWSQTSTAAAAIHSWSDPPPPSSLPASPPPSLTAWTVPFLIFMSGTAVASDHREHICCWLYRR